MTIGKPLIIADVLRRSAVQLCAVSESARLDAELLLQGVLNCGRTWLMAHGGDALNEAQYKSYVNLVSRRRAGEPIAYILKEKEFWSLSLHVSAAVLIPRPETETLVEQALLSLDRVSDPVVLDLGTGSGAVALALLHERPDARITAIDKSPSALEVARENARFLGFENSICFLQSDWFSALASPSQYDLIVSNPPYVAVGDLSLDQDVMRYEPHEALYSDKNGLADLERIIFGSCEWLNPGGILLLEHGAGQAEEVQKLLCLSHFSAVRTWDDLSGRPRVSGGLFV